jgi:hypothetical protein
MARSPYRAGEHDHRLGRKADRKNNARLCRKPGERSRELRNTRRKPENESRSNAVTASD